MPLHVLGERARLIVAVAELAVLVAALIALVALVRFYEFTLGHLMLLSEITRETPRCESRFRRRGAVTRVNRVTSIQSACGRWSAGRSPALRHKLTFALQSFPCARRLTGELVEHSGEAQEER